MGTQRGVLPLAKRSTPSSLRESVPSLNTGEVLRFAAYIADLIGNDRLGNMAWDVEGRKLLVHVTDVTHGITVAHLLGLNPRPELMRSDDAEGIAYWTGTSGHVPVLLSAPADMEVA